MLSITSFPGSESNVRHQDAAVTHHFCSCKDNGQAEGWNDDARREEDGQLFAGITGRVCVVDHPPRDAVRNGRKDVEEEEEQRPVFAAEREKREKCSQVKWRKKDWILFTALST